MYNGLIHIRGIKRIHKRRLIHRFLSLCAYLVIATGIRGAAWAAESSVVKRLKRNYPDCIGTVDDHPCTREQLYRQGDYLAALTEKEIAGYVKLAEEGDADAMYLLSQIPLELPDGKRNYPWRDQWLGKATEAGHPVAKYRLAEAAHGRGELGDGQYLAIIEAAGQAQGDGDIAWRLAFSYSHPDIENSDFRCAGNWTPRNFRFLKGNPKKALYWARIAAGKGNIMAAETLCNSFYLDTGNFRYGVPKRDARESLRWCTLAAQAMCSDHGAYSLHILFRDGIGVQKSAIDALYWKRISIEREARRLSVPVGKREYVTGASHE